MAKIHVVINSSSISWGGIVGIVTRLLAGPSSIQILAGVKYLSSVQMSRLALGPLSLLFSGEWGFFPMGKATSYEAYLHGVWRLKLSGAIPLLPLYAYMLWGGNIPLCSSHNIWHAKKGQSCHVPLNCVLLPVVYFYSLQIHPGISNISQYCTWCLIAGLSFPSLMFSSLQVSVFQVVLPFDCGAGK